MANISADWRSTNNDDVVFSSNALEHTNIFDFVVNYISCIKFAAWSAYKLSPVLVHLLNDCVFILEGRWYVLMILCFKWCITVWAGETKNCDELYAWSGVGWAQRGVLAANEARRWPVMASWVRGEARRGEVMERYGESNERQENVKIRRPVCFIKN